jgi:hypothetical protein
MGANKIKINPDLKIEQLVKELINITDKRVILEAYDDAPILKNEINLRLLKFYAEEEEKEIIIKSHDPGLLSMAQRLGISTLREVELDIPPVTPDTLENPDSYEEGKKEIAAAPEFHKPVLKEAAHRHSGQWATAVLILIFTLGLALWWFFQPKAVVTVFPKYQELEFKVPAKIGNVFKDEDIIKGEIPARILVKEDHIPVQSMATGKKVVGFSPATGKVVLVNSTNQPIVIPKGTALIGRNGLRFLTDSDVLVSQKSVKMESGIEVATVNGKAEVEITAEKRGLIGNQPAKSITRIDGKYQRYLKVTNPAPTMNGTDKKVTVVTLEDVKKSEEEARRQMELVGRDMVTAWIGDQYLYLPDLVKLEVLKISYNQNIGDESDILQTTLDYRITVLAPAWSGINKYLAKQLDRNLPPFFQATSHKVELLSAKVIAAGNSSAQLELEGKGKIRGVLSPNKIKDLIKGRTLEDAKTVLLAQNEIANAKIAISGDGSKLPGYGFQIRVLLPGGVRPK